MSNAIKQTNDGFNSIYKGNFSIGINDISYGGTAVTGFWPTTPATGATGDELVVYMPKATDGPSIYQPGVYLDTVTAFNQYRSSLEGPFITTSGFTTTQNITIPAGTTASTYPLEFNVTGLDKTTNFVTLTLGILSGSNVQNLGIVLVAPDNTTYALIKGSLSSTQSTSGEISVNISQFSGIISFNGSWDGYSGGDWESLDNNGPLGLTFEAPCPVGPFSANTNYNGTIYLTNLASGATNGTWSLYVQDFGGDNSTLLYAKLSFTFNAMMQQEECFNWAASNNDILVLNREYPSITVDSLQLLVDPWYLPSANAYAGSTSVLTKVSDLTNNNNDATTTNGVNLQSPFYDSWALSSNPFTFDTVTNIPSGNSAYTTSVWFKTSYNSQALVSFGTDTSYAANYLYVNSSGYLDNYWCGTTITSTGSTINNNNWHNAVVTYDGTIATIYIDGVFDTDLTVGTSLSVSPTSNLEIGGGYVNDFNGNMGPVMIYNRALTSTEVLNNYNNVLSTHGY